MFKPLSIEQAIELLSEEFLGIDGVCAIYDSNSGQDIIIEVAPAGPDEPRSRCPKKIPSHIGRFPISVYPGGPYKLHRQALISMPTSTQLGGTWTDDAVAAMQDNPPYFAWWYSIKSIGLVIAVATAAYYAGKDAAKRELSK